MWRTSRSAPSPSMSESPVTKRASKETHFHRSHLQSNSFSHCSQVRVGMSIQRLHRCRLRPNPSVALTLHPPLTKDTSPTTLSCLTHSLGKQKVVGLIPQIPFGVASENLNQTCQTGTVATPCGYSCSSNVTTSNLDINSSQCLLPSAEESPPAGQQRVQVFCGFF